MGLGRGPSGGGAAASEDVDEKEAAIRAKYRAMIQEKVAKQVEELKAKDEENRKRREEEDKVKQAKMKKALELKEKIASGERTKFLLKLASNCEHMIRYPINLEIPVSYDH